MIKNELLSNMIALGILQEEPPLAEMEEVEEPSEGLSVLSNQMVALRLKELELEIKRWEHNNRLLLFERV